MGRSHTRVAYIDVVPSSLFLTVSDEKRIRECVKRLAELFTDSSAKVSILHFAETKKSQRLSGTPLSQLPQKSLWWTCLPDPEDLCSTANDKSGETAYVRAWQPILRLKRAYEALRPQQVEISRLSSGLFPSDTTSTPTLPLQASPQEDGLSIHLRMGAPVSSAPQDLFITTPPSLTSALNVSLEICRSWVETNRHNTQSNLSVMRTNSATDTQRATCAPSPITIAILCEDASPKTNDCVDPHLITTASAWRNVIDNCAAEGFVLLIKDVEEINENLAKKILCLCNERLTF
ncbi:unnamed protein product [Schistocephalus solidus]|uniref:Uncharacterized protein n=1 Tax=Schistocephalus solidus TaxID=70667 RepID=A0A183SQC1_SCHSO|nr:unnamed protein product [Schistocephalus solidus]